MVARCDPPREKSSRRSLSGPKLSLPAVRLLPPPGLEARGRCLRDPVASAAIATDPQAAERKAGSVIEVTVIDGNVERAIRMLRRKLRYEGLRLRGWRRRHRRKFPRWAQRAADRPRVAGPGFG
jgi:ribosomal protein S21